MKYKNGSLESSILNVLWDLEKKGSYKNSVKDVYDMLAENPKSARAYTTIKTVMDRLFEKELLLRIKQGKKFYYRTAASSSEIIRESLEKIAYQYCNGDMAKLIHHAQNICESYTAIA